MVAITDTGRNVRAAVFPGRIATLNGLLIAAVSDDDAEQLARLLGRVSEHLRATPPRSARILHQQSHASRVVFVEPPTSERLETIGAMRPPNPRFAPSRQEAVRVVAGGAPHNRRREALLLR